MIAAKAKEAWHEDKRAFPQSFFRDYLIFEKGVAILYSQAEKKVLTKLYLLKIHVSRNLTNLWGGKRGGGGPQNVRVRRGERIGVNYVEFGTG